MNPAALQLRDIHLPAPISWWPLAPGWWVLVGLFIMLVVIGAWWRHRHQCRYYRRIALSQLAELEERCRQTPQEVALIPELSRLLRHMAILHYPSHNCAGLEGQQWLTFLDQPFDDAPFTTGVGQVLARGPYQRQEQLEYPDQLISLCRRWINHLPAVKPRRMP